MKRSTLSLPEWHEIPSDWLRAELARRQDGGAEDEPAPQQPACGSGSNKGSYNTSLHVAALILILLLSTFACSFPIVVRRFPKLHVPHRFLFVSRHFGTGVLIATAFVHLLPTAFVSLTDPCLPPFWNQGYPAMAGLIAMVSVLVVVGIEMFFATRGAGHVHGGMLDDGTAAEGEHGHLANGSAAHSHIRHESLRRFRQAPISDADREDGVALGNLPGSTDRLVEGQSPMPTQSPAFENEGSKYRDSDEEDDGDLDLDLDELDPAVDGTHLLNRRRSQENGQGPAKDDREPQRLRSHSYGHDAEHGNSHSPTMSELQEQRKMLLQCLLLEAGILFHSVFIGMALSVATGTSFVVLLVAISFHQTFEGIALGSRIAAITSLPPTSPKPWLMALAYGTTTPFGQAIGLLVHNLYDPASQTGLLMVGIMNAISSGLLLFAGLVELLAEDFLSDKSYTVLMGRKRIEACGAVVGGAMLMAFVGAFA
ncbi:MAG: hypothetical protein M4579_007405 [Chaenotheca gracillima]|nr:MAG: hypothetical protein M4579_007405 [Chaenotheca gracillima]